MKVKRDEKATGSRSELRLAGTIAILLLAAGLLMISCQTSEPEPTGAHIKAGTPEEAGKYLVQIGGCNDCHTVGYMEVDGQLPESEWLLGNPVGFRGPWGTTFPPNLRIFMDETTEDEFVEVAKTRKQKPPMPWPSLNVMNESDLRAIYRYVKSLPVTGVRAPEYVFPDVEPASAYFDFSPKHLERLAVVDPVTNTPQTAK